MVLDGLDYALSRKNGGSYILIENPSIAKTGLYLVFRQNCPLMLASLVLIVLTEFLVHVCDI